LAPPILRGHPEKGPGVVTVEWFYREKIQGDQNQVPLEQEGKNVAPELTDRRTDESQANYSAAKKKKLGENTAPGDCQSLGARNLASPLTATSQGVHPNSHNSGPGIQDGGRMPEFVDENNDENGQPSDGA